MQDKDLHIDKKLTNQGWQKMESLLDAEMPAKKKNRKTGMLWWAGGISGVAALLAGLYFFNLWDHINQATEPHPDINTLQQEKLIENNKPESIAWDKKRNNDTPVQSLSKKNGEELIDNDIVKATDNQNLSTVFSPSKNRQTVNKIDLNHKKNTQQNGRLADSEIFQEQKSNEQKPVIDSGNNSAKILPTRSAQISLMEKKALTPITVLPEKKPALKLANQPAIYPNKKTKNIIYATTLFTPGKSTNGFAVGYASEIKKIKNNWSLNAGIAYRYLAQPVQYTFTNLEADSSGLATPGFASGELVNVSFASSTSTRLFDQNGVLSSFDLSGSGISFDKLKMHYLSIPVSLQYDRGRFSYSCGLQASILLLARNNSLNGGLLQKIGIGDDVSAESSMNISNSVFLEPPALADWDLSLNVGIAYSLSKRVNIRADYLFGGKDIIENNRETDFNRLLQIGIGYQW